MLALIIKQLIHFNKTNFSSTINQDENHFLMVKEDPPYVILRHTSILILLSIFKTKNIENKHIV